MLLSLGWTLWLVGCDPVAVLDTPKDGLVAVDTDLPTTDSDAPPAAVDCDPATPALDPPTVWFADADGDGQGDPHAWYEGCAAPGARWTRDDRDCDDTDPNRFRNASEVCDPLDRDEDCDGLADDADADVAAYTLVSWYPDADGDGVPTADAVATLRCDGLVAEVSTAGADCDDADPLRFPGAPELPADGVDQDCDALESCFCDRDDDTLGGDEPAFSRDLSCVTLVVQPTDPQSECPTVSPNADDCDDAVPVGLEVCDGRDNDCDGLSDDDDPNVQADLRWLRDVDGDGVAGLGEVVYRCLRPDGYLPADAAAVDCDDTDPRVYPGAAEAVADGVDGNCDGAELCWLDADSDGFGAGTTRTSATGDLGCEGNQVAATRGDCADSDGQVHPGAPERCDAGDADEDCDGVSDDDDLAPLGATPWYYDGDGDGYGSRNDRSFRCNGGAGWVANAEDCDDAAATVWPGGAEVCNGADDDCDGGADDADDPLTGTALGAPAVSGARPWFEDVDGDGYGTDDDPIPACAAPLGRVVRGGDCDDDDPGVHPGAAEIFADGVDQSCDGEDACRLDADGDGFGSTTVVRAPVVPGAVCAGLQLSSTANDCDDADATVSPVAAEICDDRDNDCDRLIDDADPDQVGGEVFYLDADGDGEGTPTTLRVQCSPTTGFVPNPFDCDDRTASVNSHQMEVCDALDVDEDCNGYSDDLDPDVSPATQSPRWLDADLDGWGDAIAAQILACDLGPGLSAVAQDCDDTNAEVRPGAREVPADGLDSDCDGLESCYCNRDGDGYGVATTTVLRPYSIDSCAPPAVPPATAAASCDTSGVSVAETAGDCDDTNPGAGAEQGVWFYDADGDGEGSPAITITACTSPGGPWVARGLDCDDSRADINPQATEICDPADRDEDCDGLADDDDVSVSTVSHSIWYDDDDGDGYGLTSRQSCDVGPGQVTNGSDCNDNDQRVHPGAEEVIADNRDNNCDGLETCYCNRDGDQLGTDSELVQVPHAIVGGAGGLCAPPVTPPAVPAATCSPSTIAGQPGDCDDADRNVADATTLYFFDADADGFGSPLVFVQACEAPASAWVTNPDDCEDGQADVRPGATEICDLIDNDCDLSVDEGVAPGVWWQDADGDTSGNPAVELVACNRPSGFVARGSVDCYDNSGAIRPGAAEVCDFADNDCDGLEDEGVPPGEYWQDRDGDGSGNPTVGLTACATPPGFVARGSADCNDDNAAIEPGAAEVCDLADNDCDGLEDEGVRPGTFWRDADADTFGNPAITSTACAAPAGFVAAGQADCNDSSNTIRPGVSESCNAVDDNCNGSIDEAPYAAGQATTFFADFDGDGFGLTGSTVSACTLPPGYAMLGGDCIDAAARDQNPLRHPGRPEYCDNIDNDCDASVDEDAVDMVTLWEDNDSDGFGDPMSAQTGCANNLQGVEPGPVDCDDGEPGTFPGAGERCNAVDDDCNFRLDDGAWCGSLTHGFDDPLTGNAYLVVEHAFDWYVAADFCYERGYRLVWLETPEEETDIEGFTASLSISSFWIGYRRDITTWRRASGPSGSLTSPAVAAYETSSLPVGGTNGNVVRWSSGTWTSVTPTSASLSFVCEAEP